MYEDDRYLLRLLQLLNSAIHALLKNSNFLVLLLAYALEFTSRFIEFTQEVVDLNLLGLVAQLRVTLAG